MRRLPGAEAVLERRVIARVELAEALAAPGDAADASAREVAAPVPSAGAARVPVSGSVVQRWREGMTAVALAPDYRRIVELLEDELTDGGEGVRSKAKRLVERGWLTLAPSGRFMPRVSSVPDEAS